MLKSTLARLRKRYRSSRISDYIDLLTGRRDAITPPLRIIHDGTSSLAEFRHMGEEMMKEMTKFGLKPNHKVLDVGCGNGKVAVHLIRSDYLNDEGSYDGFDIVAQAIH